LVIIVSTHLSFVRRLYLALTALCACFAGSSHTAAAIAPQAKRPVIRPAQPQAQLSSEAHWARVSAVVERSVNQARSIGQQQTRARQQLDAAEYNLQRLIDELSGVMQLPAKPLLNIEPTAELAAEQLFALAA
jgi:uncharacterized protein YPO0396